MLAKDAQYKSGVRLPWRYNASGSWSNGTDQVAFEYGQTVFIESGAPRFVQTQYGGQVYDMAPITVLIVQGGKLVFNTSDVQAVNAKRVNTPVWDAPLEWQVWSEGAYSYSSSASQLDAGLPVHQFPRPVEQLNVTRDLTEYCWYTTSFTTSDRLSAAALTIDSATAQSFIAYIDDEYVGTCYNQYKSWPFTSDWLCNITVGDVAAGSHTLSLLSSSLGIENGMGSGEIPYRNHWKGVKAGGKVHVGSLDITTASTWTLRPYLTGEFLDLPSATGHSSVPWSSEWAAATGMPLTWYYAQFPAVQTPGSGVYSVLIDMTGFTRGHAFVNGHDIGRYWLIAGSDGQPTQQLYHIPPDWLVQGGMNTLTVLEEVGAVDPTAVRLYVSQLQSTTPEPQQVRAELSVVQE